MSKEIIITSKQEIIKAYELWMLEESNHPEEFLDGKDNTPEVLANSLIEYIEYVKEMDLSNL